MRVHGNQVDPNIQLNGLYGAAKTEAKLAAERVRKRLSLEAASMDAEDCVVSLSGEEAAGDEAQQQESRQQGEEKADEDGDGKFSGWA